MVRESTVLIAVISTHALEGNAMSHEQMKREVLYQTTMTVVKNMLSSGLITKEEYKAINSKFTERYNPSVSALIFDIDLI